MQEQMAFGAEKFSDEIEKILQEPVEDKQVKIRADGYIYVPEDIYHDKLNRAFGVGGWFLQKRDARSKDKFVCFEGTLWAHGRPVAEAEGGAMYNEKYNDFSEKVESAKSTCLKRCCKYLGIAANVRDEDFKRRFIREYCVRVKVEGIANKNKGETEYHWRLKADPPIGFPWKEVQVYHPQKVENGKVEEPKKETPKKKSPPSKEMYMNRVLEILEILDPKFKKEVIKLTFDVEKLSEATIEKLKGYGPVLKDYMDWYMNALQDAKEAELELPEDEALKVLKILILESGSDKKSDVEELVKNVANTMN